MKCPDCGAEAVLKDSSVIYGKSYGPVWICPDFPSCQCFVGCHKGTEKPLGTLCGPENRTWRKTAHAFFDRLWKSGRMGRKSAYAKLAEHLGVKVIHIGESNVETCKKIVEFSKAFA